MKLSSRETGKLEEEVKEAASSKEAPVPAVDDDFVRLRLDPTARRYDAAALSMCLTGEGCLRSWRGVRRDSRDAKFKRRNRQEGLL